MALNATQDGKNAWMEILTVVQEGVVGGQVLSVLAEQEPPRESRLCLMSQQDRMILHRRENQNHLAGQFWWNPLSDHLDNNTVKLAKRDT